ncbi:hypothetical protein H310_05145 [Aphanomyces invadans]|uniref:Uncharacterized protein n=1 Tax=Aphanomyces invadans TaxID=157072 RepID=A0A024UBX6_9STRA|nr:hypothetical protein H310_05145 [Aphanomyces invadans]ETW03779.1 hypothetical protein H310_05145 [Aphanomyces invadans]|eukprot:XP_008868008.1 hypothetical protein H310_05145 [Aphanomyces invadans]
MHFDDLMDYVHVDEKWIFTTKVKHTYYLAPGEEPPHRTCKSKTHIMKVMFLSAVARPRWDNSTQSWFDGKFGTWHFTEWVPAQRTSRSRPKGTLELKPVVVNCVDMATLNANFLTVQTCFQETMRAAGNNNYKIPHMKKKQLLHQVLGGLQLLEGMDLAHMMEQLDKEVSEDLAMVAICSELEELKPVDPEVDLVASVSEMGVDLE